MYIIELFIKIKEDIAKGKYKKTKLQQKPKNEVETCRHLYVPIDSTGKVLACSKCGQIYKLKKNEINPFK